MRIFNTLELSSNLIGEEELNQVSLIEIHSFYYELVVSFMKDPAIEY